MDNNVQPQTQPDTNIVAPQPQGVPPSDSEMVPNKKSGPSAILFILLFLIIAIGLGVGSYFLFKPKSQPDTKIEKAEVAKPTAVPTPMELFLTIESPSADTVVVDNKVFVKGKTLPGSTVAVYTDIDAQTFDTLSDGAFQTDIKLSEGINTITVKTISEAGDEKTEMLDIIFDSKT